MNDIKYSFLSTLAVEQETQNSENGTTFTSLPVVAALAAVSLVLIITVALLLTCMCLRRRRSNRIKKKKYMATDDKSQLPQPNTFDGAESHTYDVVKDTW